MHISTVLCICMPHNHVNEGSSIILANVRICKFIGIQIIIIIVPEKVSPRKEIAGEFTGILKLTIQFNHFSTLKFKEVVELKL